MRRRLRAAVRALLADPDIADLPDAARLAAVVLMAKTRSSDLTVRIRCPELARWLGVSESSVKHGALSALRTSQAVRTRLTSNALGRTTGLECVVMPLWRARRDRRCPLALTRPELATLLRLVETLFAPGWSHGTYRAPGLLADRRGRGAPTDRLALLLIVLDTRANGWTRLCGGRVAGRRGRPAATVARLLGCSAAGGEHVLHRLTAHGVLDVVRTTGPTGLRGAGRLRVPAVAAATGQRRCVLPGRAGADPAIDARGGKAAKTGDERLAASVVRPLRTGRGDPAGGAPLHAHHAGVAGVGECVAGSRGCFSGEAVGGEPAVAVRAHPREAGRPYGTDFAEGPALTPPRRPAARTLPSPRLGNRTPARAETGRTVTRSPVRPVDAVLDAIAPLRDQLAASPGRMRVATAAVQAVLAVLPAPVLARRLQERLAPMSVGGDACGDGAVRDPLAWLLAALPRITQCSRCGRTWHGRRTGTGLCQYCCSGQARFPPPPIGRCRRCGRSAALAMESLCGPLCGRCENAVALAAAERRAALAAVGQARDGGGAAVAAVTARLRRAAGEAARAVAAAGGAPETQRAAARLTAELWAADAARTVGTSGPNQPDHAAPGGTSAVGPRPPGPVFVSCARPGCPRRVAAALRPQSGLCRDCERRRADGERRRAGPGRPGAGEQGGRKRWPGVDAGQARPRRPGTGEAGGSQPA
jgi:hypothetical protein